MSISSNVADVLASESLPASSGTIGSKKKSLKRALSLTNISVSDSNSKKARGRKPKAAKNNINIGNDGPTCSNESLLKQVSDSSTQTTDVDLVWLHDEIKNLRDVVATLSAQVSVLVSSLSSTTTTSSLQSSADEHQPTTYAAVASDSNINSHHKPSKSTPLDISHSPKPRDQTNQDAVTAMYVDLLRKQHRSNNIVVSGLHYSDNDAVLVTELLEEEFGCDTELWPGVSVARCQRLGKQQENKIQPLLVTLDSRDQAEYYIRNARYLRSSNNQEVKSKVYINADLTPSEAKAAYELRMERKHKQPREPSRQVPSSQKQSKSTRTYYKSKVTRDTNFASGDKRGSEPISLKWRPSAATQLIQSCPLPATSGGELSPMASINSPHPTRQAITAASFFVDVGNSTSSSSSSSSSSSFASSPAAAPKSPVGRPDNAK